ncbi:MAG TPA: VWA domain-containing protein [Blastocatellia bacterium]|nr:VWA domain-containing protein [Blastocatellia bacterium]
MIRLETELVQIDVVVSDAQGRLVRDLKREDFELLEDGRPQRVTHFAVGTAARPATWLTAARYSTKDPAKPAATEVRGRFVVLAVDDYHLAPENLMLTKRTLLRFVDQQMASGDQVAVTTTSGTIGLFQQFTSERDVLQRAINRLNIQNRTVTSSFDVPRITDYQAELIDLGNQDALEVAIQEILRLEGAPPTPPGRGGRGGQAAIGTSPRERATLQAQSKARMIVAQNAHYTQTTLSTLEGMIRSLRDLPGRKLVVLLSDGFFLGGNSSSKIYDLRRITDAATRAGVVIYSIDARGLLAAIPGGDASEPSGSGGAEAAPLRARFEQGAIDAKRDGLNALARDTGGFPLFNGNDLSAGLQRVLDDNETYYVLAYEPETSYRDGRFHKLEVRVTGRPELKVRTRKGYLAPADKAAEKVAEKPKEKSPEKAAKEAQAVKESQLRAGLGSLFPLRGIPVELAADFIDAEGAGPVAVINARLDAADLNFTRVNDRHQAALDVVVVIFDEQGKAVNSVSERITLNLTPAVYERVLEQGLDYRKLVKLKPGFYQARLAVREEGSTRLGSAAQWVEVSDLAKKQLTLSSVFLTLGARADPGAAPESQAGRPTRRFGRADQLDFLVFAYNARVDKNAADLVVQSQVFSGSKLIYAAPLARMTPDGAGDPQRLGYAARLSLSAFDPGEYELRLMVIDRLAKTTAQRRANFTVE